METVHNEKKLSTLQSGSRLRKLLTCNYWLFPKGKMTQKMEGRTTESHSQRDVGLIKELILLC
jgi:hypothetical protein